MFDIYAAHGLMGAFDVGQTAQLVARYHYIEAQLMRVMAGKLASLPEWEVKCLLGLHLWHDSLHAHDFLARLVDLRWPRKAPLNPGAATRALMALLDETPDSPAVLSGIYGVIKPALAAAYADHIAAAAPVADEPTRYVLRRALAEEREHIQAGQALLHTLEDADPGATAAWEQRFRGALAAIGSLTTPGDVEREAAHSFEGQAIKPAPSVAARDRRFTIELNGFSQAPSEPTEAARFMAHRDADNEMHAAELLGRSLYEHPEMPWEYHVDMARQLWDEVRHAVLYQKYLEGLGGRLGDYPSIPGNYSYRIGLDFAHRLYDLHLRGEKLGMPDLIRYREQARAAGDAAYVMLNDYVHADEVPHVKNGRWLNWLLNDDLEAFKRVERETMQIRAAYERAHQDDPLIKAYTGLSLAVLNADS
jgi:uncharacterized ferritin-like protein (DUF455 family)